MRPPFAIKWQHFSHYCGGNALQRDLRIAGAFLGAALLLGIASCTGGANGSASLDAGRRHRRDHGKVLPRQEERHLRRSRAHQITKRICREPAQRNRILGASRWNRADHSLRRLYVRTGSVQRDGHGHVPPRAELVRRSAYDWATLERCRRARILREPGSFRQGRVCREHGVLGSDGTYDGQTSFSSLGHFKNQRGVHAAVMREACRGFGHPGRGKIRQSRPGTGFLQYVHCAILFSPTRARRVLVRLRY